MKSAAYLTHLVATTANGVEKVENLIDTTDLELISFRDFMDALPNLDDNETIYCAAEPHEVAELAEEYTIN